VSPSRKLNALKRFAAVEKDSGVRLMQYSEMIKDGKLKAEVFEHALEEFDHSAMFEKLIKKNNNSYYKLEIAPKKFMLDQGSSYEDLIEAYAYAYVGENIINKNFFYYNSSLIDQELRRVFSIIAAEEQVHARDTDEILLKFCNNDMQLYSKYLSSARRKRLKEEFLSVATGAGRGFLSFVLMLVYFVAGPFCFLSLRKRLKFSEASELEIFKSQVNDTEALK
jgi:rubrerythrin